MFYKFRKSLAAKRFYRQIEAVLQTPPLRVIPAPFSFVSMVGNQDVQMYILGMKSCYKRIGKGKLVAIIARDMPVDSQDMLLHHFPGIELQVLEEVDVGTCQRGGTWERVLYLLAHAREEYVVQMDCDTLSFGTDMREVVDCIAENRAFTLSGGEREIVSVADAARRARAIQHPYIGIAVEALLDQYPGAVNLKYVRGSSAFAGFAKGGFDRSRAEEFHAQIKSWFPDRYKEWGTEQNASNFAVANSPGSIVLPFPKYANFGPDVDYSHSSFLHFVGTYRFDNGIFAEKGLKVIAELNSY